jgi:hypothetical protein
MDDSPLPTVDEQGRWLVHQCVMTSQLDRTRFLAAIAALPEGTPGERIFEHYVRLNAEYVLPNLGYTEAEQPLVDEAIAAAAAYLEAAKGER